MIELQNCKNKTVFAAMAIMRVLQWQLRSMNLDMRLSARKEGSAYA